MAKSVEISLREVPPVVRSRLFRRQERIPDIDITRGPIRAVVVFDVSGDGVAAYHRIGKIGERAETRVLISPTKETSVTAVLGEIFSREERQGRETFDFSKYRGK